MTGRELGVYVAAVLLASFLLGVLPNAIAFGWAWGARPIGFADPLLLFFGAAGVALASVAWAIAASRRPGANVRWLMVGVLVVVPEWTFCQGGGLARSEGRGLALRAQSVPGLEAWALDAIRTGRTPDALPLPAAQLLPAGARIELHADHVEVRWYDRGLLIGAPSFRGDSDRFFFETVRPGVHVFVDER